jgi:hypothetical protein
MATAWVFEEKFAGWPMVAEKAGAKCDSGLSKHDAGCKVDRRLV